LYIFQEEEEGKDRRLASVASVPITIYTPIY
jgi:hypothetical protein